MSKKSSKAKASKATKRTSGQSQKSTDSAAKAPTSPKLIPELAALKLSPKIASKLEALSETEQDTVLNYVNSGVKINDAYERTLAGKPEQQPAADAATPAASADQAAAEATAGEPEAQAKGKKPHRAPKKTASGPGKLSAIDAAAKVLGEAGEAMNCQEMIKAMADKGYWTSPGGKTPHATLYSAILREISTKGKESRFTKTERGKFAVAKAS
jgi:HB1, ASXL, restriction endonuclease HTH domain